MVQIVVEGKHTRHYASTQSSSSPGAEGLALFIEAMQISIRRGPHGNAFSPIHASYELFLHFGLYFSS